MDSKLHRSVILIVDDTTENLKVLSQMLEQHETYTVLQAPNGNFALRIAQKAKPDAILLDVNMPDLNGYEVCRRLKENEELRRIPVIFLSAAHETFNKVKGFEQGGVDYITKPFEFEEVRARSRFG